MPHGPSDFLHPPMMGEQAAVRFSSKDGSWRHLPWPTGSKSGALAEGRFDTEGPGRYLDSLSHSRQPEAPCWTFQEDRL